jgi:HAD superfamily hydrolase (TIGR01490 family)
MPLAIFDLDNTLLNGDSDLLWGEFLCELGIVDRAVYEAKNLEFYEQYKVGTLDIFEFLAFSLKPLSEHSMEQLEAWRADFIENKILPRITQKARDLVESHREKGDCPMVITATNTFVTRPIVADLGIEYLIGTEPEIKNGRYTGKVAGTPSFREGKVERLQEWLGVYGAKLEKASFYSDSLNDLPLLEAVEFPVAVDPDDTLRAHAEDKGWPVISLR